jgi:hypothetical protein
MLIPRSKKEIQQDDAIASEEGVKEAVEFFKTIGFNAVLIDKPGKKRRVATQLPDLLVSNGQQRMVCEVKTLTSKSHEKELEAITHEIGKRMATLTKTFRYHVWYEKNLKPVELDFAKLLSELKQSIKGLTKYPHTFIFEKVVCIVLEALHSPGNYLAAFSTGGGRNKTYIHIRDLISKANRQLSARFRYKIPKICLIVNKRTSDMEWSFRGACLGDHQIEFPSGRQINSGNAALKQNHNSTISAIFLISSFWKMPTLAYINPFARTPLPPRYIDPKWVLI